MGVSTIRNIIKETCGILWDILYPMEMAPPTMEEWRDIAAGFYENSSFPNTVGAVDGKHIRLQCPKKSGTLYYNYKNFFSIILLAVCDSNYCLRVIDIGSYGKESDSNILKRSTFGKQLYSGKVNFPPDNQLPGDKNGDPQPFVLVGDEAFALSKNLLRPFPGRSLNDRRRIFNYRLSRARQYIECTFGILTNKWRVLHTRLLVETEFAVLITKACCVLHNYVRRKDSFNIEDTLNCTLQSINEKKGVGNSSSDAKNVREYFVNYVNNPNHSLAWQNRVIA